MAPELSGMDESGTRCLWNTGKRGHEADGRTMGLTLLKGPASHAAAR